MVTPNRGKLFFKRRRKIDDTDKPINSRDDSRPHDSERRSHKAGTGTGQGTGHQNTVAGDGGSRQKIRQINRGGKQTARNPRQVKRKTNESNTKS